MRWYWAAALIGLLLAALCATGCNTANILQGKVSGAVYEAGSGQTPVSGATVTTTKNAVITGTTETNEEGEYSISGLEPGTHIITAAADGYEPSGEQSVTITAGGNANRQIALTPIKGSISGKVLDSETADPLSGVTVEAFLSGASVGTDVTADDGTYAITGLDDGTYSLTASRTGYTAEQADGVVIANASAATRNFILEAAP